ncbi:MAG: cation:proton antiporter, partial [Pseudomonadota bacterium]
MYENMTVLAFFALLYSAIVGRVERTALSGPLVFVGFGLLAGPHVLGWLPLNMAHTDLRIIADLTLALVLFNDASSADLRVLKRTLELPQRLLLLGLPLTIVTGTAAGWLLFDNLDLVHLALLATMLAATDAALGKAV